MDLEASPLFILMMVEVYSIYRKRLGYCLSVVLFIISKIVYTILSMIIYDFMRRYIYFFEEMNDEMYQFRIAMFILALFSFFSLILSQVYYLKNLGYEIIDIIRVISTYYIMTIFFIFYYGDEIVVSLKI